MICGECGAFYGRKVWHSGSKYRSQIWRCNRKYDRDLPCSTPNLREDEIEGAVVIAFNRLLGDKEQYIARFEELLPLLADTSGLQGRLDNLTSRHTGMLDELRRYMGENTRQVQDQSEYNRRFEEMSRACTETENQIKKVQEDILAQQGRKEQIRRCLNELRQCGDILEAFDLDLWNAMVETVTVMADRTLVFRFRDGTEIPVKIPEKN